MDTTLSGLLGSGRGVRDGVTTPEPGGFLDTSNDERPGWFFRWPVADYRENKQVSRHSTTLKQNCCKYRINTKDGLIIHCIFVILVNVFLSILF